ncbi:DUF4349 domain-containing protein [Amycolatopsis ultiminotia]|uniref:DUF4349 domain-containing protein n=1 Tax=Amycolatopsis ultiminotia TaxID=543629 RepID=A0ABP6WNW0_9PSEU
MRTRWRCLLAGAGLVVLLAGCTGNREADTSSAAGAAPSAAGAPRTAPEQPAGSSGTPDRKLSRSARLDLATPKPGDVVARARTIATGAGGYTGQETSTPDSATLSLAVPAEKLDSVLDQLAGLGEVAKRELSAKDVTERVVDVDARLATQRASVDRVRALLAKATSVSEIASVESELTSRESELEALERQQSSLAGTVAMATVALSVTGSAGGRPSADPGGFLGGLVGGWDAFLTFGGGLLRVLGALVPFAVVPGIPAGALVWWLRRRRRPRIGANPAE